MALASSFIFQANRLGYESCNIHNNKIFMSDSILMTACVPKIEKCNEYNVLVS